MSEHILSDDLSSWPTNPYELLGVRPGALPRDLRRAYTRLIRVFKPEQYPEHFRRIRDAFEAVLCYADLFGLSSADEPSAAQDAEVPANSLRIQAPEEEFCELWECACRGEEAQAYEALLRLNREHPDRSEICVALYWLLDLFPELDPPRSPRHWLVEGLRAGGLTGVAHELYRREIEADPAEGVSGRCATLLDCRVRPGLLTDVARWRVQAAGRLGQWNMIKVDLDRLRPLLAFDDKDAWLQLLLTAVDHLAWATEDLPQQLFEHYVKEIEDAATADSHRDDRLDRLDLLQELSAGWHELQDEQGLVGELVRLIPVTWSRPLVEARPDLMAFLAHAVRNPSLTLQDFDKVHRRSRAMLTHFGALLRQAEQQAGGPVGTLTRGQTWLTAEFLDGSDWPDYREFRRQLLMFCLREVVAPEQVAEAAMTLPTFGTSAAQLVHQVSEDWPLRHLCLAHRVFWA